MGVGTAICCWLERCSYLQNKPCTYVTERRVTDKQGRVEEPLNAQW